MITKPLPLCDAKDPRRGAALIPVMLLLGLLSLLVTSLGLYVSNSATAIAIGRDRIAQHALVLSALEFGMGRVLSTPKGAPLKGEDRIRLQSGRAKFSWRGESGRIDLNLADAEILASLFTAFDVNRDQAANLARLIVARRSLTPSQPIPKDFAALSGRKLGPFDHPKELLDIPGMPKAIYPQIAPFITIFGATPQIDPRYAERDLITALPNVSAPLVAEIMSLSDLSDEDARQRASTMGNLGRYFIFNRPNVIRFRIETESKTNIKRQYEIVAIHFPDDARPYRILLWQDI